MEWHGMEWNGMEWNGMECMYTCMQKTCVHQVYIKRRTQIMHGSCLEQYMAIL